MTKAPSVFTDATVDLEHLNVRLAPGETLNPGDYTVRDGAPVDKQPAPDRCPYCEGPLFEFHTPGAMRVAQADTPPKAGVQVVGVHPMPDGLRLLKCDSCGQFFSTAKEAA